ncbi:MAG: VanW family protein [Actinobacteria bacterium]|nr:VanW family protein [Actinomycetota bacterium]
MKKIESFLKNRWKTAFFVFTLLVSILVAMPLVFFLSGRYPMRLSVNSLNLGLKSKDLVREEIIKDFEKKNEEKVELVIEGVKVNIKPENTGVLLDANKTIYRLESLYFKPEGLNWYFSLLRAFYFGERFLPSLQIDFQKLSAFKRDMDEKFGKTPLNAVVFIDDKGSPVYKPEKSGKLFKKADLLDVLRQALITGKPMVLKTKTALPKVLMEDVKRLVNEQLPIFSQKSLILTYDDVEYEIKGKDLIKTLESGVVDGKLTFIIRPDKLKEVARNFFESLEKEPKNASFAVVEGRVVIVPEKLGVAVDATRTAEIASRQLLISQRATVEVYLREVYPEITSKEAKTFGIKEMISSFTTEYNPNQTARVTNIKLLAKLLDGQLIAPGEVFSFNQRIGPRTLERGFKLAPTIVNGRLVDTAGGGACQVGTTLFNTAFFAGLKIIERHNHSFLINHYPAGRDATVSYGGYDLKFKNDYRSWILIKAYATQSKITISFYGTSENRKVRFETTGPYDLKPYRIEEVKDSTLEVGKRKIEDKGIMGQRYIVVRKVYDASGRLLYKDIFKSKYRPKTEIVRVGTKPVSKNFSTTETTQLTN